MDQFVTISNDSFNHGADEGEERERDVTDLRSAREKSYS